MTSPTAHRPTGRTLWPVLFAFVLGAVCVGTVVLVILPGRTLPDEERPVGLASPPPVRPDSPLEEPEASSREVASAALQTPERETPVEVTPTLPPPAPNPVVPAEPSESEAPPPAPAVKAPEVVVVPPRYVPRQHRDRASVAGMWEEASRVGTRFVATPEEEKEIAAVILELGSWIHDIEAALDITQERRVAFSNQAAQDAVIGAVFAGKVPESLRADLQDILDDAAASRVGIGSTELYAIREEYLPGIRSRLVARNLSLDDVDRLVEARLVLRAAVDYVEAINAAADRIISELTKAGLDGPLRTGNTAWMDPTEKQFGNVTIYFPEVRLLRYPLQKPAALSFTETRPGGGG